jgi:hypothetical protein
MKMINFIIHIEFYRFNSVYIVPSFKIFKRFDTIYTIKYNKIKFEQKNKSFLTRECYIIS